MGQARNALITISNEEKLILKRLSYPQRLSLVYKYRKEKILPLIKKGLVSEEVRNIDGTCYTVYSRTKAGDFIMSEGRDRVNV